jgi:hypothetical protein
MTHYNGPINWKTVDIASLKWVNISGLPPTRFRQITVARKHNAMLHEFNENICIIRSTSCSEDG